MNFLKAYSMTASIHFSIANIDGFVKSPDAALRCILRRCGVPKSTPHSSGFARLACELFTKPSEN
jgi:hypothetical protein